jgi:hypothetical protein
MGWESVAYSRKKAAIIEKISRKVAFNSEYCFYKLPIQTKRTIICCGMLLVEKLSSREEVLTEKKFRDSPKKGEMGNFGIQLLSSFQLV